jgi:hypothetical protein
MTTRKDAHVRNYHHVNHPRFLLYTIAFASGASDTNVKSGNSMLEGLGALEEASCATVGRAKESACVAHENGYNLLAGAFLRQTAGSLLEGDAIRLGELGTTGAVGIEGTGATDCGGASREELGAGA